MSGATADPPPTLIFFEPPLLVEGGTPELAAAAAAATKKAGKGAVAEIDDVLNSILPPRLWQQADGTSWVQYVSKVPPSRPELAQLAAALEQRLEQRQAKGTGICAVRSELYSQLFGASLGRAAGGEGGGGVRGLLLLFCACAATARPRSPTRSRAPRAPASSQTSSSARSRWTSRSAACSSSASGTRSG